MTGCATCSSLKRNIQVGLIPGYVSYFLADPVALKARPASEGHVSSLLTLWQELLSSRTRFVKPVEHYGPLDYFGPNIVVSEGAEWKRHRTPVQRSFSEHNNRLVWEESVQVALGLFQSDEWAGRDTVRIRHAVDITLPVRRALNSAPDSERACGKMALFVIGVAGSCAWGPPTRCSADVPCEDSDAACRGQRTPSSRPATA